MIDFGFDKLALIGAVALVVIGPERLPRVARTVGTLVGKAQRYVADVKAEVNRSIELEELQRMKRQFETAASDAGRAFSSEVSTLGGDLQSAWKSGDALPLPPAADGADPAETATATIHGSRDWGAPPVYRAPRKNWRLKRAALPQWYRREQGLRTKVQSGAARVARHRPPRSR